MDDTARRKEIIEQRSYPKGTQGDPLSLHIASPLATAQFLAKRLEGSGQTVCELCCGIGISLIELSNTFRQVIGVDHSSAVIKNCRRNLKAAGVKNFKLYVGSVTGPKLLSRIRADVVLYDIPYWSDHGGQVNPERQNPDLEELITKVRTHITEQIVVYAPPHFTYEDARSLLGRCEFMRVYLNGRHDRNFVFLGSLVKQEGETSIYP